MRSPGCLFRVFCQFDARAAGPGLIEDSRLRPVASWTGQLQPEAENSSRVDPGMGHVEKIRIVMRTAGPWMIFYDPKATLRHLIESIKEKRNLRNAP